MSALLLLLACGGTDPGEVAPAPTPEPVTSPAPSPAPTPGPTTPEPDDMAFALGDGPVAPDELRVVIAGVDVLCDEEGGAWLGVETVGAPTSITATPWRDGVAGEPLQLELGGDEGDAFRLHSLDTLVEACEATTWQWQVEARDSSACRWSGPDALALAPTDDCGA